MYTTRNGSHGISCVEIEVSAANNIDQFIVSLERKYKVYHQGKFLHTFIHTLEYKLT